MENVNNLVYNEGKCAYCGKKSKDHKLNEARLHLTMITGMVSIQKRLASHLNSDRNILKDNMTKRQLKKSNRKLRYPFDL